jgi:hypothetical protein
LYFTGAYRSCRRRPRSSAQRSGVQLRAPATTEPDATTPTGARVAPNASNDARRESPRAKRNHLNRRHDARSSAAMPLLGSVASRCPTDSLEPARHRANVEDMASVALPWRRMPRRLHTARRRKMVSPRAMRYAPAMAADPKDLERLVRELAELDPAERARLVAEAARRAKRLSQRSPFRRPTLTGGSLWVGGDLRREDLYGDDGR